MQCKIQMKAGIFLIAVFGLMTTRSYASIDFRNDIVSTVEASNGGPWGDWHAPRFCNPGTFARGYALGVEPPIDGDDTALNDVALYCSGIGTGFVSDYYTAPGATPWAQWSNATFCGSENHITGFRLRVEQPIDGDDTAANSMEATCDDGAMLTPSNGGPWGDWGSWTFCPANSAVCGVALKVESPIGDGDDTAVNNVRLYCCHK
jgi:hypothetical protein